MSTATITEPVLASPPLPERTYTPDDLLNHPDGVRFELVDGRLVELNMGIESNYVGGIIARLLGNHFGSPPTARVFPEQHFACFPEKPGRLRRPDVSVILSDRMTPSMFREGYFTIRPDLAIEVISPNDLVYELEVKLADYRSAGIPLVWVVTPPTRRVRVFRPDGSSTDLGPADDLTADPILSGFRCRVSDLFADLPEPVEIPGDEPL